MVTPALSRWERELCSVHNRDLPKPGRSLALRTTLQGAVEVREFGFGEGGLDFWWPDWLLALEAGPYGTIDWA